MKKISLFLLYGFLLLETALAQTCKLSIGAHQNLVKEYAQDERPGSNFWGAGSQLAFEGKVTRHLTLGFGIDHVLLETERPIATPRSRTPYRPDVPYSVHRQQVNFRYSVIFYLKEAYRGFYGEIYGASARQSFIKEDAPSRYDYLLPKDASAGLNRLYGTGVVYGYQFKVSSTIRISLFGEHLYIEGDETQLQHRLGFNIGCVL